MLGLVRQCEVLVDRSVARGSNAVTEGGIREQRRKRGGQLRKITGFN